jgi:hypothetical protein
VQGAKRTVPPAEAALTAACKEEEQSDDAAAAGSARATIAKIAIAKKAIAKIAHKSALGTMAQATLLAQAKGCKMNGWFTGVLYFCGPGLGEWQLHRGHLL